MIEAKDVLFIVLAFCALWATAFGCWLIYQVAQILKNVNDTVSDVRESISKMEKAITAIKGRFDHASSGLILLFDNIRKIVEFAIETKRKVSGKKQPPQNE